MKDFSAFLDMRELGSQSQLLKISNSLKTYSASFSRAESASFLLSTLNSLQGVLKVSSCSSM